MSLTEQTAPVRTMPQSLEAEACVLGAMVIDPATIDLVVHILQAEDFARPSHRLVFDALLAMCTAGTPIDLVLLVEHLRRRGELKRVGGADYVARLVDGVPSTASCEHYARLVKNASRRRKLIGAAEQLRAAAYDPEADMDATQAQVFRALDLRGSDRPADGPVMRCMAEVEPCAVRWLWPGRIPLGRITLLVGRPGEGKSFLAIDMAARVTRGMPWPDGSPCPTGSVLLISVEDDPADTIRPRLDAHGADVHQVHLLSGVRRAVEGGRQLETMFTLADVGALEAALRAHTGCRLLVIDPIGSFLGGHTDAHRDNEVRGVLAPVAKLAEKYGPAVLVIAHRRKGTGTFADDLALGSRAFTGIARAVWHLTRDGEDKTRRLLLPGKNNLGPEGGGLAFRIIGEPAAVAWEPGPVAMNADDALAVENGGPGEDDGGTERQEAADWLRDTLADGPVEARDVYVRARQVGVAKRTLDRAKGDLGVTAHKEGFGDSGVWRWTLPGAPAPKVANIPSVDALATLGDVGNLREKPKENGGSHAAPEGPGTLRLPSPSIGNLSVGDTPPDPADPGPHADREPTRQVAASIADAVDGPATREPARQPHHLDPERPRPGGSADHRAVQTVSGNLLLPVGQHVPGREARPGLAGGLEESSVVRTTAQADPTARRRGPPAGRPAGRGRKRCNGVNTT